MEWRTDELTPRCTCTDPIISMDSDWGAVWAPCMTCKGAATLFTGLRVDMGGLGIGRYAGHSAGGLVRGKVKVYMSSVIKLGDGASSLAEIAAKLGKPST